MHEHRRALFEQDRPVDINADIPHPVSLIEFPVGWIKILPGLIERLFHRLVICANPALPQAVVVDPGIGDRATGASPSRR